MPILLNNQHCILMETTTGTNALTASGEGNPENQSSYLILQHPDFSHELFYEVVNVYMKRLEQTQTVKNDDRNYLHSRPRRHRKRLKRNREEKTDRATTVSTCSGTTFRRAECCFGTI